MIAEDDPSRCPICRGIHTVHPCPLVILREPPKTISPEEDYRNRLFLERCTRGERRYRRKPLARA